MKLKIVITDANILIDLIKVDLSVVLFESSIFEFKTTDFVFAELFEEQRKLLIPIVEKGHLHIIKSEGSDIHEIYTLRSQTKALSFEDCSVWYYALKYKGTLLTGDKQLRNHTSRAGIDVRGILFLFDQMLCNGIISYELAVEKLTCLYKKNKRLPKKEVEERINNWKNR